MYGYEPVIEITPQQLLQKVTQEAIFEFALEQNFSWTARYKSKFRTHSKDIGTCRFEQREDGTILFVDFGDLTGRTHRTCFRMVMDIHKCDLIGAMKIICQKFNLPTTVEHYDSAVAQTYQYFDTENKIKVPAKISYEAKPYNKWDIEYWTRNLIRPEHLKEDNVFNVARYRIESNKGINLFTPYKYCYVIDLFTRQKIYQPYNTEYKFITNFDEDTIGNINNLPPTGDELIVQKSYKDHRVVRNVIPNSNVIYLHNEGCVPDIEILTMLTKRFKLITVFYDNDATGIVAAINLVTVFNNIRKNCARMIHMPFDGPKDPSAFVWKEGRLDLIEVFKAIGLWNML